MIDNLTRFDELDYSGFVVAKNNECFHKYKEYLPRLRLTIPKDLVRMFLCWPVLIHLIDDISISVLDC